MIPNDMPRHNHMTRDIKPEGQCPMCDRHHQRRRANEARGSGSRERQSNPPEIEARRLYGGPLDGETVDAPPHMVVLVGVECPWGPGEVFHFAVAEYDLAGDWIVTRCTSTEDDPLEERP